MHRGSPLHSNLNQFKMKSDETISCLVTGCMTCAPEPHGAGGHLSGLCRQETENSISTDIEVTKSPLTCQGRWGRTINVLQGRVKAISF